MTLASSAHFIFDTEQTAPAINTATHKKASGLYSANTAAQGPAGSAAFGAKLKPINTRGIDKIASTFGDKILARFRVNGLADHVSEKLIQHMLSIRAMVDPKDSLALVVAQAAAEPESRGQPPQPLLACLLVQPNRFGEAGGQYVG
jgi:hypothetical protein